MPIYRTARPNTEDAYLAGRIERWLVSKGYIIGAGGVSVTVPVIAEDGEILRDAEVVVDCDRDPSADIAAYQFTELDDGERLVRIARASLNAALDEIRAKAPANRTPAERAVLAITVLMRTRELGGGE